jgi:polysaccharide biosynthesis transport protein
MTQLANAIYKKLWIVILVPLLAAGLAYFLTWKKSGQYKSTAVIEASIPDPSTADARTLKDIQQPDDYYDNMVATMKTELITSMVSYRLLMHDLEGDIAFRPPAIQYSNDRKELIKTKLEKKLASFDLLSETDGTEQTINKVIHNMDYDIARWLRDEQIIIARKPGSNDIDISVLTEDPFLSAFAANTLGQEYIRYEGNILAPPVVDSNDSVSFYREETERLRRDLEQKSGELKEAQVTKKAPVDEVRFRRAKANRAAEYKMRIVEEEWEANNLREQLAKLQAQSVPATTSTGAVDVASSAKVQTIRKKIDQLTRIYQDGGSKDRQLDSIITRLKTQVNEEALRLQAAKQKTSTNQVSSAWVRDREMLMSRIAQHDEKIRSLRNDIRRLNNTTQVSGSNDNVIAKLQAEHNEAEIAYNTSLATLQRVQAKSVVVESPRSRTGHHLILKSKALPSAQPESPFALLIIFGAFMGTLVICIVVIALTRPAPPPDDSIFLRVNYANQRKSVRRQAEG